MFKIDTAYNMISVKKTTLESWGLLTEGNKGLGLFFVG